MPGKKNKDISEKLYERQFSGERKSLDLPNIERGEAPMIYDSVDEDINARDTSEESYDIDTYSGGIPEEISWDALDGTATDIYTGGATAGGETEDMTTGNFGQGRRMGGATGGDVFGAGAGSGGVNFEDMPAHAVGVDKSIASHPDSGLESRIAAENVEEELREDIRE